MQQRSSKRRKKDARSAFFDIEAEVEDEDEDAEEDEENAEIEDFIDPTHPDDLAEAGDVDDRYHRELDRRRQDEDDVGAEEVAERLKRDYGRKNAYGAGGGLGDTTVVPKRLLLPSVDDPSIWAVRCREGKEFEVVMNIYKKMDEAFGTANELGIISAFERTQVGAAVESINKGYIYIEALKREPVERALDGILDVYPRTKMFLVEIKEMPDLLRVQPPVKLEVGAFVRIRRPKLYEGDLAEIQEVEDSGLNCRVRLVPRVDYNSSAKGPDGKRKRFGGGFNVPRPPPRLFSEVEARKRAPGGVTGSAVSGTWYYKNEQYIGGYLIKEFKLQNVDTKNVVPTLEEIERFSVTDKNEGTQNLDMAALATSLKESNASIAYLPGDTIEVFKGEQKGLVGRVTNVQGEIITLQAIDGELHGQLLEVPAKSIRKRFRVGDHVKVTSGSRYHDEVGVVVFIEEDKVTFVTDGEKTHITVFSKDLREADDTGGTGTLGQYSMLDLVQLDATSVGVIVKADRETLTILDQDGNTKQLRPTQIANIIPKKKLFVAADRNGSEMRYDDVVKEYGGQQRQGKIIHIHRSWVWLHNNDSRENAGVFVVKTSNLTTVAAKGGRVQNAGPDLNQMNPELKRNANNNSMAPPPKQSFGRDRSIGQTVTIRKGGYKGLLGIVKDTTDLSARVELHTKGKIVTVPKADLLFKDKITGRTIDINGRGGGFGGRGGFSGGRGGFDSGFGSGSRTPQVSGGIGGRTPAWGGAGKLSVDARIFDHSLTFHRRSYSSVERRSQRWSHTGLGRSRRLTHSQPIRREPHRLRQLRLLRLRITHTCLVLGRKDSRARRLQSRFQDTRLRRLRRRLGVGSRFQDTCIRRLSSHTRRIEQHE